MFTIPQPTIKFNGPLPLNPIADQVPENDFQDLQRPKDVSTDPDSVRSYLQNELLKEKLLPENEKGRRRYTPRHINDSGTIGSFEDLTVASNDTEEIIDTNDIVQTDDIIANNENVQTNEIIDNNENVETVEDPVNFDKITEPNSQKKFIFISAKNINKIDDEDDETRLAKVPTPPKKRRIEARDPPAPPETQLPPRRIFLELIEAQNNMDRISRERERELQSKRPTFVPEYIDPKQMILAKRNAKKGTFLSHNGKNKLTANPETGIIFHPYRLPGKPEPFSKESALHCYKYVDTKPPYLDREKLYWKSLNMGPPPHDYHQKDIDGKPRKAAPTKEYFQRILGGRPRSHSCTTYSENESIYIEKNKLDKDKPKESRRSKSADPPPCSRNKLFIKYMMRKFTIPNLNMEAQLIFSFLRKYETGKYFQVFCIFWAEYYKRVEIRCRKEGKEFETPTIWNVIPYENKRLSEADTAKIAPEPTRINTKPWINDYVNRVLNFFYYDEKPSIPVIQPLHEQLTKHPLIISSAKSKLKHLVYEQLSMKQFFFNLLNGNEEARKIWIARKNVLKQTRLIEKRFFGIEGINDFLPQQFRAKTVSQIPEDHRIFLNDQNGWLLERMIEIRTDEEIKRKKEEEKLRKVALRKAAIVSEEAKRKASGLSPVKPPPPKKAARKKPAGKKRKSKGGQSQKLVSKEPPLTKGRKRTHSEGVDENDENQIIAQCSKSHERDFSPELTASYFSQYVS
uniref:Uncharacterized protein n=1 Tax=Panagrolaimus superbus TaxID=310955 RepID=A0A914YW77_9BILA